MASDEQNDASVETEEWKIGCSDDEKECPSNWEPKPEEILNLYLQLEQKGILELEWQCPGRRSPSVHSSESESVDRKQMDDDDLKLKRCETNEFDFDDDVSNPSTPKITPRRKTPGTSAQKKVARLDKVMFDLRRYRHLDEMDKKSQTPSPRQNIYSLPRQPSTD